MELQNFKNVQLIIGEPSYEVRIGLKTAFCAAGFEHGHIKDTDKVSARGGRGPSGGDLGVRRRNRRTGAAALRPRQWWNCSSRRFAVVIHEAEAILCFGIPLVGKRSPKPQGLRVIATLVGSDTVLIRPCNYWNCER